MVSGHISASVERKIILMQNISFFNGFSEPELHETALMSQWLKFFPGDYIVKEGNIGASFWILLKGSVSVIKKIPGRSKFNVLAVIPTGECFGEMSIISGQPRTADIIADNEVFLFKIEAHKLEKARDSLQLKFFKKFSEILVARLMRTSNSYAKAT